MSFGQLPPEVTEIVRKELSPPARGSLSRAARRYAEEEAYQRPFFEEAAEYFEFPAARYAAFDWAGAMRGAYKERSERTPEENRLYDEGRVFADVANALAEAHRELPAGEAWSTIVRVDSEANFTRDLQYLARWLARVGAGGTRWQVAAIIFAKIFQALDESRAEGTTWSAAGGWDFADAFDKYVGPVLGPAAQDKDAAREVMLVAEDAARDVVEARPDLHHLAEGLALAFRRLLYLRLAPKDYIYYVLAHPGVEALFPEVTDAAKSVDIADL